MKKYFSILLLFVVAASAMATEGVAGPYKVSVRTDPVTVPVGKATVLVDVRDQAGKPVRSASVKVFAKMPGMSMGEREETAAATATPGEYSAPATFAMAGSYDVALSVDGASGSGKTTLTLTTGQSSSSGTGGSPLLGYLFAATAAIGVVIWRMKVTGQKFSVKTAFNRSSMLSLGLVVAALSVAFWVIKSFRREGSMTPLEAQTMEMNTPAPEGEIPVVLAEVKSQPFAETVSYSGQVVGYVEQDVVPRVSGTIVAMPVYVGDHVKKGQLLARLDTSQLDPMVAEKSAGVTSASEGVSVATSEYRQALDMADQSFAEVSMAESEVAESKSMLDAAKAGKATAEAGVASAQADERSAQADVTSADADRDYQRQELGRMRALFDKGAVSKDEWQRAQADAQKAEATATSAHERLRKAESMLRASNSELVRADAEVSAASTRVSKAEANVRAKKAQARTSSSGVQSAKAKVGQSRAAVAEASAGLRGAATQKNFSELRAEVDGVVTQRLISPGVVVNAGQSILRVAQVSPIRLQANVPQDDLARVRVGSLVFVRLGRDDRHPLELKVTTVSPAVDTSSRMGTVEATYANLNLKFSPGQFVTLEIAVGEPGSRLVIPAGAVLTENSGGETFGYVWVATSAPGGSYTVSKQEVKVGGRAGGFVSILSGVSLGQRVVVSPQGIVAGARVRPVEDPVAMNNDPMTIELTADGYQPSSVNLEAGKPTKLVFVRRVADTCATSVEFPEVGVRADTPLNEPVTVEIPAQPSGKELTFTCPMNMYKGRAVAR